ncbi:DUF2382 domain-containing protein [Amycolatopsis sp. NPDC059021]|uniref:DUF2382 domain-containing protein n=1 Tax=Amycolatopsis sp. NPDC059021 TaxID=3346704 RepID=UPI00367098F9
MASTLSPQQLLDSAVVDPEGNKIGKVGNVYLADATRQPEWITVRTGLFGTKESFVPLQGANMERDGVHVNVAKDQVSEAPRIDADGRLSMDESAELYRHYGMPVPRTAPDAGIGRGPAGSGQGGRAGGRPEDRGKAAKSGKGTPDAEMIRSEEQLNVGTEQVETGHVRLRKYVVTEEQQVTVPVRHEEVRIEREPITDGSARPGDELGEQEQDIALHAEKPVVRKETRPVERLRASTETVTEDQTVTGEVRKEQFDVQDDSTKKRRKS